MRTVIGATIVAVLVSLCVSCAQVPVKPAPGIRDKIDRDAGYRGTVRHVYTWSNVPVRTLLS